MKVLIASYVFLLIRVTVWAQPASPARTVSPEKMREVYEQVKTPYKYGIVLPQPDKGRMVDSPTIFRKGETWCMTYIIFDGKGNKIFPISSLATVVYRPSNRC